MELGWRDLTTLRDKQDDELSSLVDGAGPELRLLHATPGWFVELGAVCTELELGRSGTYGNDRLDGPRDQWHLAGGTQFALGAGRLELGAEAWSSQTNLAGKLPNLLGGIDGFDPAEASLSWEETGLGLSAGYDLRKVGLTLYGAVTEDSAAVSGTTAVDELAMHISGSGQHFGTVLRLGPKCHPEFEAMYLTAQSSATGRFSRLAEPLGPADADWSFTTYGIRAPLSERFSISATRGSYELALAGSADLSSFTDGVFGLLTPRGHLESAYRVELSTLMATYRGDGSLSSFAGVSRYEADAHALTYGTALFGSVRLAERESTTEKSGWLGHIGVQKTWQLQRQSALKLKVSQTVPVSSDGDNDSGPIPPGPPTNDKIDGGRVVSLSYIYSF